MKGLLIAAFAAAIGMSAPYAAAVETATASGVYEKDVVKHGGGCRKSSPPGKCCHMDNRTGTVHCH